MSVMPDTAKDLVRLGASLIIEESTFMPETLKELALLAQSADARLVIGGKLMPNTMKEIASLAPGKITFKI